MESAFMSARSRKCVMIVLETNENSGFRQRSTAKSTNSDYIICHSSEIKLLQVLNLDYVVNRTSIYDDFVTLN